MLRLYNLGLAPLRPIGSLWARWKARDPRHADEWRERWAMVVPSVRPGGWWIHGASLGEARLVGVLAREARSRRPGLPLVVSAVTRTGRAALPGRPEVDHACFAPLDFRGLPGRVLDGARPAGLVLVETELWPNWIDEASSRGVPVAVVNGRLAPERMAGYRRSRRLFREVLAKVAVVGAQSEDDASRFAELGLEPDRIRVTGNLKFDLHVDRIDEDDACRRLGFARGVRPIVVAGSTGAGEDGAVLDAFLHARKVHRDLVLVLAPRHVDRVPGAEAEAAARGLSTRRWTVDPPASGPATPDVVVVDATGVLAGLYGRADVAFVGGSLVPVGGHNVLEPACLGVPVLFGPHTGHVAEPARLLLEAGAARRVADSAALGRTWVELLSSADTCARMGFAGRTLVDRHRGASARTVDLLSTTFDRRSAA